MKIKMQQEVMEKEMNEAFREFLRYCRVKNLSAQSLAYYEECFETFLKFFSQTSNSKDITKNVIDDYVLHLRSNTSLNDISINSRLRGVRVILYYFMELGYTPRFKIQLIKAEKKVKETYSDAELKLLLKKPDVRKCIFTEGEHV